MSDPPSGIAVPTTQEYPPLRHNRDFLLLRSGQAVSVLGTRVSALAFPLLVLALTGSPAKAGAVSVANTLPQLLFNLPAGVYVDRWNRKRVMVACDVIRALAMGSIPLVYMLGRLSILQLALVAFLEGSCSVFFSLAEGAAVPLIVAPHQLPDAYAQDEAVRRGAQMTGPPLSGALYGLGQLLPFLFDALTYGISVISLLFIRVPFQKERSTEDRGLLRSELTTGMRWLWRQPFLRMSTLLVAGTNVLFGANFLVVIVLARQLGTSSGAIGLIFGIGGLGGVLGALLAGWIGKRLSPSHVVLGVNWLWAILFPLFALAPNAAVLGVLNGLCVFAGPMWNVVLGSLFRVIVPNKLQARVDGAQTMFTYGAIPLGPALGGALLQTIGARPAVVVLSILMLAIALAGQLSPAIRSMPSLAKRASVHPSVAE
ncbi:MAG TPA: MFS transporter [Chloroflexota bacterium]